MAERRTWLSTLVKDRQARQLEPLKEEAAPLPDTAVHDAVSLQQRGLVEVRAVGQSLTHIRAEIKSLAAKPLRIRLDLGTYFAACGNFQNMVTRRPYHLNLAPGEQRSVTIEAACINAGRPVPTRTDRFRGIAHAAPPVVRFIREAEGAEAMVVQAGVWALTDHYTASDLRRHLVTQDQFGGRRPAVSETQINEARRILRRAGLANRL